MRLATHKKYECDVKLFCDPSDDELQSSGKRRTRYVVREVEQIVDAARKLAYKKAALASSVSATRPSVRGSNWYPLRRAHKS